MTLHPEQIKIYRTLSPAEKLNLVDRLYYSARQLKVAAIQRQHPNWSKEKVNSEVTKIFLHASS